MSQRACSSCSNPLDRRNKSGVCKTCNPITGAAASVSAKSTTTGDSMVTDGRTATVVKNTTREIKSLGDLIEVCEIDTEVWTIKRHEIQARNGIYTVKAHLIMRAEERDIEAEIASLKADAKAGIPAWPDHSVDYSEGGYMLEIPITDPHFGKLAWADETGDANYDTKVAIQRVVDSVNTLLRRTSMFTFEQIVLVLGGDLFHVDSKANTTTGGTSVDVDSRQQKTFKTVRVLMTQIIERLRTIAPVKVVFVTGNHDRQSLWHLGDSIESWYHATPSVEIDNEPTPRKYHQFGKVMLMWTHGDKGRKEDYPLLIATEQPRMFGETRYREVHTGHLHQTRTQEKHGVRVRILPALCAADAWHSENGMVGNIQGAEAYVWSKEEGLASKAFYTVPSEE